MSDPKATLVRLSFGRWLRRARDAAKLTQAEVAKEIGFETAQFISNWERGVSDPPVHAYATLVRIYRLERREAFNRYKSIKMLPVERELGKLKERIG